MPVGPLLHLSPKPQTIKPNDYSIFGILSGARFPPSTGWLEAAAACYRGDRWQEAGFGVGKRGMGLVFWVEDFGVFVFWLEVFWVLVFWVEDFWF